jgi:hypothetical protein
MAVPSLALATVLHETADRLERTAHYQWSHFGHCNCGHLAQTVTRLSAAEIHRRAFVELTEWSEIPEDFCPTTGLRLDFILDRFRELGLDRNDLRHLEDLSDLVVLRALPGGFRYLRRNDPAAAVLYLRTWAALMAAHCAPPEESTHGGEPVWAAEGVLADS